jgi:hypothetical protein
MIQIKFGRLGVAWFAEAVEQAKAAMQIKAARRDRVMVVAIGIERG